MQFMAQVVAAFQAGHEGSIPFARTFARSNANSQVKALAGYTRSGSRPPAIPVRATYVPHAGAIIPQLAIFGVSLDCVDRTSRTRSPSAIAIALSRSLVAC